MTAGIITYGAKDKSFALFSTQRRCYLCHPCACHKRVFVLGALCDRTTAAAHARPRLLTGDSCVNPFVISIHAARVRRDTAYPTGYSRRIQFQSTQRVYAATACREDLAQHPPISIHAAHVRCDHFLSIYIIAFGQFQSTQRMYAATFIIAYYTMIVKCISIHAAHVRCDVKLSLKNIIPCLFQSTQRMYAATAKVPK